MTQQVFLLRNQFVAKQRIAFGCPQRVAPNVAVCGCLSRACDSALARQLSSLAIWCRKAPGRAAAARQRRSAASRWHARVAASVRRRDSQRCWYWHWPPLPRRRRPRCSATKHGVSTPAQPQRAPNRVTSPNSSSSPSEWQQSSSSSAAPPWSSKPASAAAVPLVVALISITRETNVVCVPVCWALVASFVPLNTRDTLPTAEALRFDRSSGQHSAAADPHQALRLAQKRHQGAAVALVVHHVAQQIHLRLDLGRRVAVHRRYDLCLARRVCREHATSTTSARPASLAHCVVGKT